MRSRLPQAILFDLDDTIIAYDAHTDALWKSVCDRFAPCLHSHSAEELFQAIHKTADWFWSDPERHLRGRMNLPTARREIMTIVLDGLGIKASDLAMRIADTYSDEREDWTFLIPGAKETLDLLKEHQIKLALVTNGSAESQRRKIQKFGLEPFFDYILIEGEYGFGKPNRRVFEHTVTMLGVPAGQAWMVGDNLEWEISVPQQLGMFAVWVDWRNQGLPSQSAVTPDLIVGSIARLPHHLGIRNSNGE